MVIFDLDGTLIEGYMDREDKYFALVRVLPGRREKLVTLLAAGVVVGIATNQGGVAFGFVTESAVKRKLAAAVNLLGLPPDTQVAICYSHPKAKIAQYRRDDPRRKPGGGMLRELAAESGVNRNDVLYVGDQPEDKQAASSAGVSFRWAEDFFAPDDEG
jgi:D-glycero-D-manno-heptose 1,7-bisphosphate phosphatase